MAKGTLSLWPASIRPKIKSPATILAAQAKELALQTDGVLIGELKTRDSDDAQQSVHTLDVFAPTLNYRHRVLTARHMKDLIYPVLVAAEVFRPKKHGYIGSISIPKITLAGRPEPKEDYEAEEASDEELIELVKRVLNSPEVVGVAISLIARVEELAGQQAEAGNAVPSPAPA